MYKCTLHRQGKNIVVAADNWKNLHKLILQHAMQDSQWGMLYKDGERWEYSFFPMTSLPERAPKQFEITNRRKQLRRAG